VKGKQQKQFISREFNRSLQFVYEARNKSQLLTLKKRINVIYRGLNRSVYELPRNHGGEQSNCVSDGNSYRL